MKIPPEVMQILKLLGAPAKWLALVVAILGVGFLIFKWWKKRQEAQAAADPAAPPKGATAKSSAPAPKKAAELPANALLSVWRSFTRGLSPEYRRSILRFQPFLVLGPAKQGKTTIIDAYTDHRRQQHQLSFDYLEDPRLQIYFASRMVVLELAPNLTEDPEAGDGRSGRKALKKLFGNIFSQQKAIVLVVLDAQRLNSMREDQRRLEAEKIRGRIDVLAEAQGSPVEVRLVLSGLELLEEGYQTFTRWASQESIPLVLAPVTDADKLSQDLLSRTHHLPRLVTDLKAPDLVKVVSFFRATPRLFPQVASFLSILGAEDGLSKAPRLEGIYLHGPDGPGAANPFYCSATEAAARGPNPLVKHRLVALAGSAFITLFLAAGYHHHRSSWVSADVAHLEYPVVSTPEREGRLRRDITQFLRRRHQPGLRRILPVFYVAAEDGMRAALVQGLRAKVVEPRLEEVLASANPLKGSLYLYALSYATRKNPLGERLHGREGHWAAITGLSADIVTDYVDFNPGPPPQVPRLDRLSSDGSLLESYDPQPWMELAREIDQVLAQGYVEPERLMQIQRRAADMNQHLSALVDAEEAEALVTALNAVSTHDFRGAYRPFLAGLASTSGVYGARNKLREFLEQILRSEVAVRDQKPGGLRALSERIRLELAATSTRTGSPEVSTMMGSVQVRLDIQEWQNLVIKSRVRLELLSFFRAGVKPSTFFDGSAVPPARSLVEETGYLFSLPSPIASQYTPTAFETQVGPTLVAFAEVFARAAVSLDERQEIDQTLRNLMTEYAQDYAAALTEHYRGFRLQAHSADQVRLALAQMAREGGDFQRLLARVAAHGGLRLDTIPYTEPLSAALRPFAPLVALVGVKTGTVAAPPSPGLQSYQDILKLLAADLGPVQGPAAPEKPEENKGRLEDRLMPEGRFALKVIAEPQTSVLSATRTWLKQVGIEPPFDRPFLEPGERALAVGLRDIEMAVDWVWRQEMRPSLVALSRDFPFSKDGTDVSVTELTRLLHPVDGLFFQKWRDFVAPVVEDRGSEWRGRALLQGQFRLPVDLLSTANRVRRLAGLLWDEKGKPQVLRVEVTPVPFGFGQPEGVTLVGLRVAKAQVLNFNQAPRSQVLEVPWDVPSAAALGVEILNMETRVRRTASVRREASAWAFLRLLMAAEAEGVRRTWRVPENRTNDEPVFEVSFDFNSDPFSYFDFGLSGYAAVSWSAQ